MKGLLFTYVLTYGGAAAAVVNPWVGVLIYICFAIVRPSDLWPWSVPAGNYSRIIAIAMLVGWSLKGFGSLQFGRARSTVLALTGFFGWSIVCALSAPNREVSWQYVDSLSKVYAPFLVGITLIDSWAKVKQLAWTIVGSEAYLSYFFNETYLLSGFNIAEDGFGGMGRAVLGVGLVACLALAFFLSLDAERLWERLLACGSALLIGHAIFLTFSRGAILSLIVTGGVGFALIPKKPKHWAGLLLAIAVGLRMAGPQVRARFSTTFADGQEREASAQSRLDLWRGCLDVMLKHPLTGVGPAHWPLVAHEYGWEEGKEAHSLWMQTGAELGFPGLLLLGSLYGVTIAQLLPHARLYGRSRQREVAIYAAMVVAALVGFVVGAQFVSVILLEVPFYVALLGAGVLKLASPWNHPTAARLQPSTL